MSPPQRRYRDCHADPRDGDEREEMRRTHRIYVSSGAEHSKPSIVTRPGALWRLCQDVFRCSGIGDHGVETPVRVMYEVEIWRARSVYDEDRRKRFLWVKVSAKA